MCSRCLCSHSGPGVSCALCVFISDPLCFMTVHLWSPCLLVWCACIQALVRAAGSVCGPGGNYGHAPREEADPLSPTLSCSCLSFGVAASPYLIPLRQTTRLSSTFGFFDFQDIFLTFRIQKNTGTLKSKPGLAFCFNRGCSPCSLLF